MIAVTVTMNVIKKLNPKTGTSVVGLASALATLALLTFATSAFAQIETTGYRFYLSSIQQSITTDTLYFIDTDGDTAALFDIKTGKFGFNSLAPDVSLYSAGDIKAETSISTILQTYVHNQENTTPTSHAKLRLETGGASGGDPYVHFTQGSTSWSIGLDNSASDRFKVSKSSGLGSNDIFYFDHDGTDATISFSGYVQRQEITSFDAIAWFPPADSGAVLDTLANQLEVLDFYHNTDSTHAVLTWQVPSYFNSIDSAEVWVITPNGAGDSTAWALSYKALTEDEPYTASYTVAGRDTIDLGVTSNVYKKLTITGFSGIVGGDIVDFLLLMDNTISNQVQAAVHLRSVRFFWK